MAKKQETETSLEKAQAHAPAPVTADAVVLNAGNFQQLQAFAEYMATARNTIPQHLQQNPGDCFAIVMQASMWEMNPYAVAQKTHLVNGKLGYEAQLVNAVINQSRVLDGRPNYDYIGDWSKIEGKASWNPKDEEGLAVRVYATLRDSGEQRDHICYMTSCKVRNSPNWKTKPKLQLCYQAIKEWCRIHTPDVILGVYTVDEIDARPTATISVTDMPSRGSSRTDQLADLLDDNDGPPPIDAEATEVEPEPPAPKPDPEPPAPEPEASKDPIPTQSALMQAVAKAGIPDDLLNEYLAHHDGIKSGGDSYIDAKADWKRRIVANPAGLKKAVEAWVDEPAG